MKPKIRVLAIGVALALAATAVLLTAPRQTEADAAVFITDYEYIPAAAFTPSSSTSVFYNYGTYLHHESSTFELFVAPVYLDGPAPTVHSVTLHYWDNDSDTICLKTYRTTLKHGTVKTMSSLCTNGAAAKVRSRSDYTIKAATVSPGQAITVSVQIPSGSAPTYHLSGVTVGYTPGS